MSPNDDSPSLPPELQQLVEQELNADEQLLWTGQPMLTSVGAGVQIVACLSGANMTFGLVVWMCWMLWLGAPLWFALLAIPFLYPAFLFLSAPFVERQEMKETVYAVTDQRAIILRKKSRSTKIESYKPEDLSLVRCPDRLFEDGTKDILFKIPGRKSDNIGFFNVPNAQKVERLLKELAAKVPKEKPLSRQYDSPIILFGNHVPREIPLSLHLYLRQYAEDSPHAMVGWIVAGFGLFVIIVGVAVPVKAPEIWIPKLMFIGVSLPFVMIGLYLVFCTWFVSGPKMIRFLQEGIATEARHLATFATGKTDEESVEIQVDFEYQVDGKIYHVSAKRYDDVSRLTDALCKVVFYDPAEPKQSMLLDDMPRGIHFDELMGRFCVNPLRCVPAFVAGAVVCGEIVVLVVLARG